MENPYKPPSTPRAATPKHASLTRAAADGFQTAFRRAAIVFGPILVLGFVGMQVFFIGRGISVGIWPEYNAPQFWYSTVAFAFSLLVVLFAVCVFAGLFAAATCSARHLAKRGHVTH
jgi:hypothetical protein